MQPVRLCLLWPKFFEQTHEEARTSVDRRKEKCNYLSSWADLLSTLIRAKEILRVRLDWWNKYQQPHLWMGTISFASWGIKHGQQVTNLVGKILFVRGVKKLVEEGVGSKNYLPNYPPPDHNLGQILNSDPASSYFPLNTPTVFVCIFNGWNKIPMFPCIYPVLLGKVSKPTVIRNFSLVGYTLGTLGWGWGGLWLTTA